MAQSSIIRFTLHCGTFWNATFFKTLTTDETTSLQWEETIHIERIAKQIHLLLNLKNCPIECTILFIRKSPNLCNFFYHHVIY